MAIENLTRAELEAGDITRKVLFANPSKEADALLVSWSLGLFRIRAEKDETFRFADLCGDCYNPVVNPDIPAEKLEREKRAFRSRVNRMGVWGVIAEVRPTRQDEWREADSGDDSIWGFVGGDFIGSGYEQQMMKGAHNWLTTGNVTDSVYGLYVQSFWASSTLLELADKLANEEHAKILQLVARRLGDYRSRIAKG